MNNGDKKRLDWDAVKEQLRAAEKLFNDSSAGDDERLETVFRQRAEQLASADAQTASTAATTPMLVFDLGNEKYGIELRYVAQISKETATTPVPNAPAELLGVANLQGEVRSVLDLRRVLKLPDGDAESSKYILLLRKDGCEVGLRVEQINEVRQVAWEDVAKIDDQATNELTECVTGVARDNLIILRPDVFFENYSFQGAYIT